MYLASVILLLAVCPAASIAVEWFAGGHSGGLMPLVGKWFVFWAVGVRLFIAGLRQAIQPSFTAETIFGVKEIAAHAIVREVGFGNLSMGTLGIATLAIPVWISPAAIVGGLYYGLAAALHVAHRERNAHEQIALISDAGVFVVLAAAAIASLKG